MKHKKKKLTLKIKKKTIWQISTAVLAILLIASVAVNYGGSCTGGITSGEAGTQVVGFINNYLTDGKSPVALKDVDEQNEMYVVNFEVQGQSYPSYVSKDGKLLFLQVIEMDQVIADAEAKEETQTAPAPSSVPKAEKPEVDVFVMTHCPYGTQIEKGVIPVAELLGDKIDLSVKFVYYAMHGKTELDEQLLQHCIQKEQEDKYLGYLTCFLGEGKTTDCLETTGIDTDMANACVASTDAEFQVTEKFEDRTTWLNDRFPLYDVDKADNTKYGVRGSPHLVINGQTASAGRDSASILKAVCDSFTTAPEECNTELSSAPPAPGFGFEGTGSASAATCG